MENSTKIYIVSWVHGSKRQIMKRGDASTHLYPCRGISLFIELSPPSSNRQQQQDVSAWRPFSTERPSGRNVLLLLFVAAGGAYLNKKRNPSTLLSRAPKKRDFCGIIHWVLASFVLFQVYFDDNAFARVNCEFRTFTCNGVFVHCSIGTFT